MLPTRSFRASLAVYAAIILGSVLSLAYAQDEVELTYWTHWGQNPIFNQWYVDVAEEVADEVPGLAGVELVDIAYEGYLAKYRTAFNTGAGAPDFFNGMAHNWFQVADPMPAEFVEKVEASIPEFLHGVCVWDDVRYGVPVEGGNFMMMYINTDMFEAAGLDPDDPPETFAELLDYAKQLTEYNDAGVVTRAGYGIRYEGHPLGIADKWLPFLHAFNGRLVAEDWSTADGYVNSPEAIQALEYYDTLVNEEKVSSLQLGNPDSAFGQGLAAIVFRESWYAGWLQQNAPSINYKVYALPDNVGPGALFPWCNMVYKNSPHTEVAWDFMEAIWTPEYDLEQHAAQGLMPVFTENLENSEFVRTQPTYDAMIESLAREAAPEYYHPLISEIAFVVGEAITAVLYDQIDAESALNNAAVEIDRLLSRN